MEIKRAIEFENDIREKTSGVFVESCGKDLKFFSNEPNKMAKAFSLMFALDYFYVATTDDETAGFRC
ncbi:MAG: hypothetical protein LBG43_06505 [Treponema sp.]|nr:hypothetical protein [Treponema sp.]